MKRLALLLPFALLLAAAPKAEVDPSESLRLAEAAAKRGEFDSALRHYDSAEDATRDPGLVAFNKACVHFQRGEHRVAERGFTACLDDAECPSERRAKALYNRGVCELKRGGLAQFRNAIASFESALKALPSDEPLSADARHNLEVAKHLWLEARQREQTKRLPSDPPEAPPPTPERPREKPNAAPPEFDPGHGDGSNPFGQKPQQVGTKPNGSNPRTTDQQTAGVGKAKVIATADQIPNWNRDEMRDYLARLAARVATERRDTAAMTAPPERPNVKDW